MSRIFSKKRLVLGVVTALVAAVAAMAYYTTTGDGTGTGAADDGYADKLDIASTMAVNPNGLVPGGSTAVNGTVENNNPGSAEVTTVVDTDIDAGLSDEGDDDGPPAGDCDDSWFTIADIQVNTVLDAADDPQVPGGDDSTPFAGTIVMADSTADQNACKGAEIKISWSSDDVPGP